MAIITSWRLVHRFQGTLHDKKLSDEVQILERLPEGCEVDADKGYQGLADQVSWGTLRNPETGVEQQVPRVTVHTPFKKPKGKELTDPQQVFNRQLAAALYRMGKKLGDSRYPLSLLSCHLYIDYANGLWTRQQTDPTLAKAARIC